MLGTELHWVDGPWPGKLAMAARPRGGDWLEDEMAHWQRSGIDTVLSLLEPHEERDLDIASERTEAEAKGMTFLSFPIVDRQVPAADSRFKEVLLQVNGELAAGRNVVLHCRQGIGRTGLMAACLFLSKGFDLTTAIELLSKARGIPIPETPEQRSWLERYAASAAAKAAF